MGWEVHPWRNELQGPTCSNCLFPIYGPRTLQSPYTSYLPRFFCNSPNVFLSISQCFQRFSNMFRVFPVLSWILFSCECIVKKRHSIAQMQYIYSTPWSGRLVLPAQVSIPIPNQRHNYTATPEATSSWLLQPAG